MSLNAKQECTTDDVYPALRLVCLCMPHLNLSIFSLEKCFFKAYSFEITITS